MASASKLEKSSKVNVREEALKTLVQWESGDENLDEICQEFLKALPEKNRSFYLELVKGTLRHLLYLDYKLQQLSAYPLPSLPRWILNILRLGGYQLDFISSVPKAVTVHLMVELAKTYGHPGTVRLVNGLLRHFASASSIVFPEALAERLSIEYSHPSWLVNRWLDRFGPSDTRALLAWDNLIPLLEIQLNELRIKPSLFLLLCQGKNASISPAMLPGSFAIELSQSLEKFPGYQEGLFWIQSPAASLPVSVLAPKANERILDLCAAPGGKTCQMAVAMEDSGEILAVDKNPKRMKKLEENRRRLGLRSIRTLTADARQLSKMQFPPFDGVLVDAPCSSTGVLRRKVDACWKKTPGDFIRFSNLQLELLASAGNLVKANGRLVYATCSLEPEENQNVVGRFLAGNPAFCKEDPRPYLPKSLPADIVQEDAVQTYPHQHHLDGFFVALLRKKNDEH